MGKRFVIVIGVAAAGVMALGAQTATAAPDVVKYDTAVTISKDRDIVWGQVESKVRNCHKLRRVVLFKQRPGADRKLRTVRSSAHQFPSPGRSGWRVSDRSIRGQVQRGDVLYAQVPREVHDEFVCRRDRSGPLSHHGLKAGLAATSTTEERVDRVPPDLRLSGATKQSQAIVPPRGGGGWWLGCDRQFCDVTVMVSCGDEACTARATGKLTKVKNGNLLAGRRDPDPGETRPIRLHLKLKTRKQALEALDDGEKVRAKVTVRAKDAAGNVATAKRTIKIRRGAGL